MAITADISRPYNTSPTNEAEWRLFMPQGVNDGVYRNFLSEMLPFGDSTGMQVKVSSGGAWGKGQWGNFTGTTILPIAANASGNPRIDLIVMRNLFNNWFELDVIQGTAAAAPVVPALTRNTVKQEVPIGTVDVANGAVTISAANVKDCRQWGGPPIVTVPDDYSLFADKLSSCQRVSINGDVAVAASTAYFVAMRALSDMTVSKVLTCCSTVHTAGTVSPAIYRGFHPSQLTTQIVPTGLSWPVAGNIATGTFTAQNIRAGEWIAFLLWGNASMAGLSLAGTVSATTGGVTNLLNPSTATAMTAGFKTSFSGPTPTTLNILDGTWAKRDRYYWCGFDA